MIKRAEKITWWESQTPMIKKRLAEKYRCEKWYEMLSESDIYHIYDKEKGFAEKIANSETSNIEGFDKMFSDRTIFGYYYEMHVKITKEFRFYVKRIWRNLGCSVDTHPVEVYYLNVFDNTKEMHPDNKPVFRKQLDKLLSFKECFEIFKNRKEL